MKQTLFQSTRKKTKKHPAEKHLCPVKCMALFSLATLYSNLLGCVLLLLFSRSGYEAFFAHTAAEELLHSFFRAAALTSVFICTTAILKAKYTNT